MVLKTLFSISLFICCFSLFANEAKAPRGLVFLMHGCNQTDEIFSKSTNLEVRLRQEGFEVAYIKETKLNHLKCWEWYHEKSFTPDSSWMKAFTQEIQTAQNQFNIPAAQTYLVGFSSGAGMALNIAMCTENLIGGIALHAGPAFARVKTSLASVDMGMSAVDFIKDPDQARFKKILSSCDPTKYDGHLLSIQGAADKFVHLRHSEMIMQDLGAVKAHQSTHIKNSCEPWLIDTHLTIWQKGRQKLHQLLVPKLGHAWGGGDPKYEYTDPKAPSTTEAIIQFLKNL